jgi:hypothetical protein
VALTAQEKADVIYLLGWPGLTIVQDSTDYSKPIVDNLTVISSPMEVQVRALLTRLKNLEEKLAGASCRLSAKKIGDIELRDDEISQLKKERKRALKELSRLLDIPLLVPSGVNIGVCV